MRPATVALLAASILAPACAAAGPRIEWESKDAVESRMTRYKYARGPKYETPKDPKAKDPGHNYGSISLTVSDDPPRLLDRVLKRGAKLTGRIAAAPGAAKTGRVWLEDNYGRVLDRAAVKAPGFAFRLDASRALHTGIYLKAELVGGDGKAVWSGKEDIRMVPPGDPWADFILGVYNMGTKPGTGQLWRRMGLTHRAVQTTNSPAFPVQNDLAFHASNIVYSLLGLYHRDYRRWREIKAAQAAARGPVTLARHRCLSNPKEREFIRIILEAAALRFRPYRPLHYSIGDEIGVGDMASPHDLCASKWCLARYRAWLKTRYATLAKLNAHWDTAYKTWDDVKMFSNWQALERAKTANFAPWADRLEFMDHVLYDAVDRGVKVIRSIDPTARCNVSGVQQPSCWQFDHWLLANTVDCATPYEIGEGPDVLMSFFEDGRRGKLHSPGFGGSSEGLWRAFLRGYHLAAQWDSFGRGTYSKMIDIDSRRLTPLGEMYRNFADWVHAGPGRLRKRSRRRRDGVAILYSQPSLRANWILEMTHRPDVPDRGDKWATRGSWSVRQRELSFRVRISWVQWTHDVGIWPKFVDARQLGGGHLKKNGFRVLILPRVVAVSDATAAAIRRFAEGGGMVIADTWCGLMDETCKLRPGEKGALDDMFGVKRADWRKLELTKLAPGKAGIALDGAMLPFMPLERTLKAAGDARAGATLRGADVVVTRKVGKGRAVYLNFRLESYFLHRMLGGMTTAARSLLLKTLADAGVRPAFTVSRPGRDLRFHTVGHDVCVYTSGRGYLVGVRPNPTIMRSEVGGIETQYKQLKGNVFNDPQPAQLNVPAGLWVYDLTDGGKSLGEVRAAPFRSVPNTGRLFACWPFEIKGLTLQAAVTRKRRLKITGTVNTSAPVADEKLVVALEILRPDGTEQRAYRRTIDCTKNRFAVELPLGLDDRGKWTVVVREPCSANLAQITVHLR